MEEFTVRRTSKESDQAREDDCVVGLSVDYFHNCCPGGGPRPRQS